jgi:hypothetical protein
MSVPSIRRATGGVLVVVLATGIAAVLAHTGNGAARAGWYLLGGLVVLSVGGLATFLRRRRGTRRPTDFV